MTNPNHIPQPNETFSDIRQTAGGIFVAAFANDYIRQIPSPEPKPMSADDKEALRVAQLRVGHLTGSAALKSTEVEPPVQ
jgi:hypothetical protein|tara:strand:+ start:57 stop:296 length:240 start_codon:yes stop_codon:yes gene_type:complete